MMKKGQFVRKILLKKAKFRDQNQTPDKPVIYTDFDMSDRLESDKADFAERFIGAVRSDTSTALHSILIVKEDKVVASFYDEGYGEDIWHETYSTAKSVVSLTVGALVDRDMISLSDDIGDILGYKSKRGISVEDLLLMKSGVKFRETDTPFSTNWIEDAVRSQKEKEFDYNSLNTYLLSAVIEKVEGRDFREVVDEYLFQPLGIKRYFFEKGDKGIAKGGWGLYALAEDLAKLGILVLNRGVYKGRRIISEKYIDSMTTPRCKTPLNIGSYEYGYHIWVKDGIYLFNGLMGQNVFILPQKKIVVVTFSGSGDIFQTYGIYGMVEDYFIKGKDVESGVLEKTEGKRDRIDLDFDGEYQVVPVAQKIGVMPFLRCAFANNYDTGIDRIKIDLKGGEIALGKVKIPVDTSKRRSFVYEQNGERYACSTKIYIEGEALRLEIAFVETAVKRFIEIDILRSTVRFYETPGEEFLDNGVELLLLDKGGGRMAKSLYFGKSVQRIVDRIFDNSTKIKKLKSKNS